MRAWQRGMWLSVCVVSGAAGVAVGEAMASSGRKATFAAGCFWGVEKIFAMVPGVLSTTVGYTGGHVSGPTYPQVCTGTTGHAEAVEVVYDPARVSYEQLLVIFWEWHDPTTRDAQGPDVGAQYRSAIFTHDEEQAALARRAKQRLDAAQIFPAPIVTEIAPAGPFYPAEPYHQAYLVKHPGGYCSHRLQPSSPMIRAVLAGKPSATPARR